MRSLLSTVGAVEGVRSFGSLGVNVNELHESVAKVIVAELIEQRTLRLRGADLVYCGPLAGRES